MKNRNYPVKGNAGRIPVTACGLFVSISLNPAIVHSPTTTFIGVAGVASSTKKNISVVRTPDQIKAPSSSLSCFSFYLLWSVETIRPCLGACTFSERPPQSNLLSSFFFFFWSVISSSFLFVTQVRGISSSSRD